MTGISPDAADLAVRPRPAGDAGRPFAVGGARDSDEVDLRIARDGARFYHGTPIACKPLVRPRSGGPGLQAAGAPVLARPAEGTLE
ncbi:MAG: hypothetical protein ACT4P2_02810 [Pseudomonadota bacterium]